MATRAFRQLVSMAPEIGCSADGLIEGTYLHGVFALDAFRAAYLESLGMKDTKDF